MCITDHHDITLAVKVALNLSTTNQHTGHSSTAKCFEYGVDIFMCPCIDRPGHIVFVLSVRLSVCLSIKKLTLATTFEW